MNQEELLDHDEQESRGKELWMAVQWWEKKRLNYNIIVGLCGLTSLGFLLTSDGFFQENNKAAIYTILFISSCCYAIAANVAYTSGAAIEMLTIYYSKNRFNNLTRSILWGIGLFFSVLLTLGIGLAAYTTTPNNF
ncbi:MAG: hypothetical protein GY810_02690 [Aureispira sp.]|nr:hypothetical protein [Aureispira sp.]